MTQTVYLVDDEPIVLQPMRILVTAFGYDCRAFSDAASLLNEIVAHPNGIVLADLRMPEMTGLQLFHKLRDAGIAIPFILVSGHADFETVGSALERGINGFLAKPFEPEELQDIIQRTLTDCS